MRVVEARQIEASKKIATDRYSRDLILSVVVIIKTYAEM